MTATNPKNPKKPKIYRAKRKPQTPKGERVSDSQEAPKMSKTEQNRQALSELCSKLKKREGQRMNEVLALHYSSAAGEMLQFETYANWIKKGYRVNHGEKAYHFWSNPMYFVKNAKGELVKVHFTEVQPNDEAIELFNVAYLFSNRQVSQVN